MRCGLYGSDDLDDGGLDSVLDGDENVQMVDQIVDQMEMRWFRWWI